MTHPLENTGLICPICGNLLKLGQNHSEYFGYITCRSFPKNHTYSILFAIVENYDNFLLTEEEIILFEKNLLINNYKGEGGNFQCQINYNFDTENEGSVTLKQFRADPYSKTLENDIKKIILLI